MQWNIPANVGHAGDTKSAHMKNGGRWSASAYALHLELESTRNEGRTVWFWSMYPSQQAGARRNCRRRMTEIYHLICIQLRNTVWPLNWFLQIALFICCYWASSSAPIDADTPLCWPLTVHTTVCVWPDPADRCLAKTCPIGLNMVNDYLLHGMHGELSLTADASGTHRAYARTSL